MIETIACLHVQIGTHLKFHADGAPFSVVEVYLQRTRDGRSTRIICALLTLLPDGDLAKTVPDMPIVTLETTLQVLGDRETLYHIQTTEARVMRDGATCTIWASDILLAQQQADTLRAQREIMREHAAILPRLREKMDGEAEGDDPPP